MSTFTLLQVNQNLPVASAGGIYIYQHALENEKTLSAVMMCRDVEHCNRRKMVKVWCVHATSENCISSHISTFACLHVNEYLPVVFAKDIYIYQHALENEATLSAVMVCRDVERHNQRNMVCNAAQN